MYLEEEIRKKIKNVVFLEIKKETKIKDVLIKKNTPLPIKLNSLVSGITNDEFKENVSLEKVNEAIVYFLGIERDFKYTDEYKKILNTSIKDIKNYILYLGSLSAKKEEFIDSYIYLNSYDMFLEFDIDLEFAKTNSLENIYNLNFNKLSDEDKNKILSKIIKSYENIIDKDSKFPLSYYRLGYINRATGNYIKSKLYFEKFLANSKDNMELEEEVRENLKEIDDYANMESAKTYLAYSKFDEALSYLNKVSSIYPNKDEIYYLKSLALYNLGYTQKALESIKEALEIKTFDDYYNQAAIASVANRQEDEAVNYYKLGLEEFPESYLLNYNLGVLLLNKSDKNSVQYLEKAYEINPNNELEEFINKIKGV